MPASAATPTARVLLVEDKESLRAMLKLALEQQHYMVVEAADAEEAARALASGPLAHRRAVPRPRCRQSSS